MATPTTCTIYTVNADFFPWDGALPEQQSSQVFGLESGPHGSSVPGPGPPLQPEPGGGHLQPGRRRLQLLHPEARPRRRRSVPRQAELHDASGPDRQPARDHLLPRSLDRWGPPKPWAKSSRPTRAVRPPQKSAHQTLPRDPDPTPSTRSARSIWRGRSKGPPSASSRSPPPSPAPMTTAPSSSGSRSTSIRSTPT